MGPHPATLHKTLVIRFSSVGDIVLSSALLRVLRKRFPDCMVDYVVKEEYADLVRHNPCVTHVLEFPTRGTFGDLQRLRRTIRAAGYDLVVDLHDSLRSRYLSFGSTPVVRINKRKLARMLLIAFKWNVYERAGGSPSVAERYVETMAPWGITSDDKGLDLFIPSAATGIARMRLQERGIPTGTPCIGVCPSARHGNKIWPGERYAEAAALLAREHRSAIVLFGGPDEEGKCNDIAALISSRNPGITVANLAGKLSLLETAAAMDSCALVITNDSGLMHVAAARKRRIVALFGPTVRELGFFPYGTEHIVVETSGLACRPCTHIGLPSCPKGHFRCMRDITTEQVAGAAARLLTTQSP